MLSVLNKSNLKLAHGIAREYGTTDFNCWGATLFVLNQESELKWIGQGYMEEFLAKKTEEVLGNTQIGDILVLRSQYSGLEHTAVYIGRNRFWHKRGGQISEVIDENGIMDIYFECDLKEIRRLRSDLC